MAMYTPGSGPSNMDMSSKKREAAQKMAKAKKAKPDMTGFMTQGQVDKLKKSGKFKGFDGNPMGYKGPIE